jgi:branched-subunit amino acid aminotransferase/4-amino-4-deoxychorismate lyase
VSSTVRRSRNAGQLFVWGASRRLAPCAHEDDPPLIADSWLVSDGRVRGLDRHRRRFFRGCIEVAHIPREQLHAFWQATVRELPRRGRWFPRVELCARPRAELRLRIRPAPPRGAAVRLWAWDEPDPRTAPRRKGPDLARLAEVRRRALRAGADDALLTTRSGLVLETTNSSVLWWEGECLCMPSPALRILPGVPARLVREIARQSGTRLRHRRRRAPDLDGCEVWLVNALHGIRTVSRWMGTSVVAGPPVRAPVWQSRLEACAEPLPARSKSHRARPSP